MTHQPRLFIHVGLHKTGTSYLQQSVFPHVDGITYLGRPYSAGLSIEPVVHARHADEIFLISNEKFSFPAISPDYLDPDKRALSVKAMREQCLSRLKALLPSATPIVAVRNPLDWIESTYTQYVKYFGTRSPEEFWSSSGDGCVGASDVTFDSLVDHVTSLFDRAFVFDYDELSGDQTALLNGLCTFLGVERSAPPTANKTINGRPTQKQIDTLRALNNKPYSERDRKVMRDDILGELCPDNLFQFPANIRKEITEATRANWDMARSKISSLRQ
ncbi:MAG: sulfotransferase [Pseudomonadota bacterium]